MSDTGLHDPTEVVLRLFRADGAEINAPLKYLSKVEAGRISVWAFRRLANDQTGTYWMISHRPSRIPVVIMLKLDRNPATHGWRLRYQRKGRATSLQYDIYGAIARYQEELGDASVPPNVAELALRYVYLQPGGPVK